MVRPEAEPWSDASTVASYIPARQAANIDPMVALTNEKRKTCSEEAILSGVGNGGPKMTLRKSLLIQKCNLI
jgi:hypothetical protein